MAGLRAAAPLPRLAAAAAAGALLLAPLARAQTLVSTIPEGCYAYDVSWIDVSIKNRAPDMTAPNAGVGITSPTVCQTTCNGDPLCHHFTWSSTAQSLAFQPSPISFYPGFQPGSCWTHGIGKSLSRMKGYVAGPKDCSPESIAAFQQLVAEKLGTAVPTAAPTEPATASPTAAPTASPTAAPTASPTAAPTASPTAAPTAAPAAAPTAPPTAAVTLPPLPTLPTLPPLNLSTLPPLNLSTLPLVTLPPVVTLPPAVKTTTTALRTSSSTSTTTSTTTTTTTTNATNTTAPLVGGGETGGMPWWSWVLIGLGVFLLCFLLLCLARSYGGTTKAPKKKKKQRAVRIEEQVAVPVAAEEQRPLISQPPVQMAQPVPAPAMWVTEPVVTAVVPAQTTMVAPPVVTAVVPAQQTYMAQPRGVTYAAVPAQTARPGDLFDRIDRNHDGVISRSEFAAAMR